MRCPNCQDESQTVEMIDPDGGELMLYQCPTCGGIWLNKGALSRVPSKMIEKIDSPTSSKIRPQNLQCPHDRAILTEVSDVKYPAISFWRCASCGGSFFQKGTLYAYKTLEKEKNLMNIEISKKAITNLSIFLVFLLLSFLFVYSSESIIKADPVKIQQYGPVLYQLKITLILLFILVCLIILLYFLNFLRRRRMR